jgi:hypothetical protein
MCGFGSNGGLLTLPWKRVVLLLSIAMVVTSSAAQQTTPPAGDAVANPGRPTVTTPATLTPVGYLQFESGVIAAWHSPEFTAQQGFNETVKLAVSQRLQLLAVTQPFAYSRIEDKTGTDPGGIALGGQAVLHLGEGAKPTVAASYLRQVYGGTAPDLDLGSPIDSVILLASADVKGFHYDTNAMFNRVSQDVVHRPQFGQTLSISHPVTKRFAVSGEIWHFTQPFLHGNAIGNLWALSYSQRKNIVWDGGFNRGLTRTSTCWEAFIGFTYLLPHRLWR